MTKRTLKVLGQFLELNRILTNQLSKALWSEEAHEDLVNKLRLQTHLQQCIVRKSRKLMKGCISLKQYLDAGEYFIAHQSESYEAIYRQVTEILTKPNL